MRAIESECGKRILITDEQDEFILLEIREVALPVGAADPEKMHFLCIAREKYTPDLRVPGTQFTAVFDCHAVLPREAPFQEFQWIADDVGNAGGLITGTLHDLLLEMVVWMPPKIAEAFQRVLTWVDSRIKE